MVLLMFKKDYDLYQSKYEYFIFTFYQNQISIRYLYKIQ